MSPHPQPQDATGSWIVKRSAWQRIADCFFGYDFFVSYTWKDGATYAFRLAKALEQRGFDCFLDSQSYVKGDDWKIVGAAAIRRTSKLRSEERRVGKECRSRW